jgi:hypothetical protein
MTEWPGSTRIDGLRKHNICMIKLNHGDEYNDVCVRSE